MKLLIIKKTEMETQMFVVAKQIITALNSFCSTIWGKVISTMGFFATIGLASIAPLIHIIIGFVFLDMIFGLAATIYKKGWGHILSHRLRDSLVKVFFYLIIVIGLFVIETQLIDGYALTAKAAFALISGVELWSIMASMLILFPNFPVIKFLKGLLSKEISKKLGIDTSELEKELENIE